MADDQPSLHIDTDWKKQAQEEKRKLADEEHKRAADREAAKSAASAPAMSPEDLAPTAGRPASAGPSSPSRSRSGARGERAIPEASFATLVSSLATQVLLYLGDLTPRGVEPQVNLDMAKFNVDLLGVIEEKTKNNLTPDEQKMLDNALYEARMRYVSVASQYATV
jgi:hypothetical protein